MAAKKCTKCGTEKPLAEFYRRSASPDGLQPLCKACDNKRAKDPAINRAASKRYRSLNTEACDQRVRAWQSRNQDRIRAARSGRKGKEKATNAAYYQANKDDYAVRVAKRRDLKLKAIPCWADLEQIKKLYKDAARRTRETGIKHHVDHVVPLQHQLVCGLHSHTNLEVIPAMLNFAKNNRHWPDMP